MVQSNHATRGITASYPQGEGVPNIVLVGVPDVSALNRVRCKLSAAQIPHYCWNEPDHDFGFTAIATAALDGEQRLALKNYRLWSYSPGAPKGACLLIEDGGAKAAVAQLPEHSAFSREVGGSIPSCGSNIPCQEMRD